MTRFYDRPIRVERSYIIFPDGKRERIKLIGKGMFKEELGLEGAQRGAVKEMARAALLSHPQLREDPQALRAAVLSRSTQREEW